MRNSLKIKIKIGAKSLKSFYFLLVLSLSCCTKQQIEADILIMNGKVYDGYSNAPREVSIAIKNDKIIFIGDHKTINITSKKTIDAKGLIVSPGFIDPHTHADRDLKDAATAHNQPFLFQGVTTVVVGNDGDSFYPTSKFKKKYESQGVGTNVVALVGHGTIRELVLGKSDKSPTEQDIMKMQALIQEEMDAGAFGMSTGLFYAPGSYSGTQEIIALAKTISKNEGIYDTHLRDESTYTVGLGAAIDEAIEVGRNAKLPIHISHIKCLGVDVWGKSNELIEKIEKARSEGIAVTANQYPYEASATGLKAAVVPRWAESGGKDSLFIRYNTPEMKEKILNETKMNIKRRGGPDKLLLVKVQDTTFLNKTLAQISLELNIPAEIAVYEILKTGYVRIASFNMTEKDIHNFMRQSWTVTGSDGNTGHPRKYGSFPRKYHTYVKDKKVIDCNTFITNSTSKTAEIFKIQKRGKLQQGFFADIILFNPDSFKDKADYTDAFQLSEGLIYSIINGKIVIENGIFNNTLNGRVLSKLE